MESKSIVLQNRLVRYNEWVGGDGPVFLFLHGWRSNKEAWNGVLRRLREEGVRGRFFALDLPGFGASEAPLAPWSVGNYAEIVVEWMQKLGLSSATVCGHSFGGRVSIVLASRFSEVVDRLVLVDAAGFVNRSLRVRIVKALSRFVHPIMRLSIMQSLRRALYRRLGAEDAVSTPHLAETFRRVISEDLSEDMRRIDCPTLLIWGEHDVETPPLFAKRMAELIPNTKTVLLPGAGHFSFVDKESEFVRAVSAFIQEV